ncbi:MAG: hypothetical protein KKB39_04860 [Nanoarchaeota archaeon]|nr:hypothetical protein [Nanoarchaeota archaeon]
MEIVENLTRENLLSIVKTGKLVYTPLEEEFLTEYAPYSFYKKTLPSLDEIMKDEMIMLEINQRIFTGTVALDIPVARTKDETPQDLASLVKSKSRIVNPYFEALEIGKVDCNQDPLSALAEIKIKSCKVLDMLTQNIKYETQIRDKITDKFLDVKEKTFELYGDVPALIFGSALTSKNPGDIDVKVILPDFSVETYKKIKGSNNTNRNPPINFIIVPEQYLKAWVLSDAYPAFEPDYSVIINKSITVPSLPKKREQKLRRGNSVNRYMEARIALQSDKLGYAKKIIEIMNNRLKIPKFIHMDFSENYTNDLEKPNLIKFSKLPNLETYTEALIHTNLELNKLLREFYKKKESLILEADIPFV